MTLSKNRIKYLEKQLDTKFEQDWSPQFIELLSHIAKLHPPAAITVLVMSPQHVKTWSGTSRLTIDDLFRWGETPEGGNFWYRMYLSIHDGREWEGSYD